MILIGQSLIAKDMDVPNTSDECPHCGSHAFRSWEDLSEDDLFIARRMPSSAEFTDEERKKHRICTRCWFERIEDEIRSA